MDLRQLPSRRGVPTALTTLCVILMSGCSGALFLESPVPPDSCATDAECPTGQRCSDNACIDASTPCSIWVPDGVCPATLTCCDGVCASVTTCDDFCACEPDEGCRGGTCVTIEDEDRCSAFNLEGICPGTEVCVRGQCVPCDPSNTCSASIPNGCCPAGNVCATGVCRPEGEVPEELCSMANPDGACPPGQLCNSGVCELAPCSPQVPTGFCTTLGEACIDGQCQALPCSPTQPQGVCTDSAQYCSAAGRCINTGTCAADADCISGERCSAAEQCIGATACLVDEDCGPFDKCENMACERDFVCANDMDCLDTEFCSIMLQCVPDGDCLDTADCAMGQFCSAADTCINDGTCIVDPDCTNPQTCGESQVCLNPGDCAVDGDCLPGRTCTAPTCDVDPADLCTVNKAVDDPCPGGETCCAEGQRCSATDGNGDRACIQDGQCVDDSDCLNDGMGTQWYTCNTTTNLCEPVTTCTSSGECGAGERCSVNGACIPTDGCAEDSDCTPGQVCNALFECEAATGCGSEEFMTTLVEPNMLVFFDRSGSMSINVAGSTGGVCVVDAPQDSRWNIARNSLVSVATATEDTIRYGLSAYPHYCPASQLECGLAGVGCRPDDCSTGTVDSCDWDAACAVFETNTSPEDICRRFSGCEWTTQCEPRVPDLAAQWSAICSQVTAGFDPATVCNLFPWCEWDGDSCEEEARMSVYSLEENNANRVPGRVDVTVGPQTAAALSASLEPPGGGFGTQHPGGNTPTDRAFRYLASHRDEFALPDPADLAPRDNFALLITDGNTNSAGACFGVCDQDSQCLCTRYTDQQGCESVTGCSWDGANCTGTRPDWNPSGVYGTFNNDAERVNCGLDYLRQGGCAWDGANCNGAGANCAGLGQAACEARTEPVVRTFVVGFVGGGPDRLNCHAVWGGTSRCGAGSAASGAPESMLAPRCEDVTTEGQCVGGCTWGGSSCTGPTGCDTFSVQEDCEDAGWPGCTWDGVNCGGGVTGANCNSTSETCFFRADNASELEEAFQDIAGAVASCTFTLDQAVTDLDQLFVFVEYIAPPNEVQLGRIANDPDGWWEFDQATERLTILGQACDDVQNGLATPKVVFGCGGGG